MHSVLALLRRCPLIAHIRNPTTACRCECSDFTAKYHRGTTDEWSVALTCGSTDAISKLVEVVCDPGDVVLCEAYTWSTPLDGMRSRGIHLVGIDVDDHGMVPSALKREIISAEASGRTIKALYIVPNGSNPCGTTLLPERFAQIYELCVAHGVLVLEDDPYWWLGLGGAKEPLPGPPTSFAAIDTDARVVRIDSFAKSIAPGFRLGWLSGPPRFVNAFNAACSTSTHNGSPFAMAALHALLEHWGEAGLHAHIERMRTEYRRRLHVILGAADKHLAGLASWRAPKAGMFLFLDLSPSGVEDSTKLLPMLREHRVLTIPSAVFSPSGTPSPHMRISFSQASDDDIAKGISRLGALLREHKTTRRGAGS